MKKVILLSMVLVLMLFLLPSCGVSEEEYAKVSAELATAQTEISGLQSELSAKESELQGVQNKLSTKESDFQTMQSQLSAKESELQAVQSQLSDKESQLQTVQSQLSDKESELHSVQSQLEAASEKLEQGKARMEVINGIWVPIMKEESPGGVDYFFEWRDQIIGVGDPALTEKFNDMLDRLTDEAILKFFVYLFESTAKVLE